MDDTQFREQVHDLLDAIVRRATGAALTVSARESHADQAMAVANGTLDSPADALLALIDLRIEQGIARQLREIADRLAP